MAQTRKKKILQQVQRQRRQRTMITFTIVAVLIVIIVAAIFFLPRTPPNPVQLPTYLDKCVTSELPGYHSHPNITIIIGGVIHPIPANLGIQASCLKPIHTHDTTGTIHIEPDENRTFTLNDFFLVWGNWASDRTFAIFNSTQIFDHKTGNGHQLNMTVNGSPDTSFQNHQFPHNAASTSTLCVYGPPQGYPPCVPDNIMITYS